MHLLEDALTLEAFTGCGIGDLPVLKVSVSIWVVGNGSKGKIKI